MMGNLTRRHFLRAAGLAGFGVAASPVWRALAAGDNAPWQGPTAIAWGGYPLGRVTLNVLTAYAEPSWRAPSKGVLYYDDVVGVQGAVEGEGLYYNNNVFLNTEHGFLYSSFVQPVRNQHNGVRHDVGEGFWAQVTVPVTEARSRPDPASSRRSRMYFSTVHRVVGITSGTDSQPWYEVSEQYFTYFMPAAHLRPISPDEVGPTGGVPPDARRIEVHIGSQSLTAFEGENAVLTSLCSTGSPGWDTPFGNYPIIDKRHGTRMTGAASDEYYNLPGVPFATYITNSWVAIHGAYWHNDYGRRRSHGCINVPPEVARWLFRWTTPHANYHAFRTWTASTDQPGTVVNISW
jgi:hypothetical protein